MLSQFQKKVQNLEDGILEYVAKRQAQNVLKIDEKDDKKKEKGYFDKLKDKILNEDDKQKKEEQQNVQNKNDIMSKLKDRLGINNKDKNEQEEQKDNKKPQSQIKTISDEYAIKAKKYANDLGDQFNKLFNKKKTATPIKDQIQKDYEEEEQKHQNQQQNSQQTHNNGWILPEQQEQNKGNVNQQKKEVQSDNQNLLNQKNRIFHNKYDSDQESEDDISSVGSVHDQSEINQHQQNANNNFNRGQYQHNNNNANYNNPFGNRVNTEDNDNSFQHNRNNRKQIFANQIPQNTFQINQNQNNQSNDFDRSFNDTQAYRDNFNRNKSPMLQTKRRIFDEISIDNDDSYSQHQRNKNNNQQTLFNQQADRRNNSFTQPEEFNNNQRFNNRINENRYYNQQDFLGNTQQFNKQENEFRNNEIGSQYKNRQDQNINRFQDNRNGNSQDFSMNNQFRDNQDKYGQQNQFQRNDSSFNQQFGYQQEQHQIQSQRRRIFNNNLDESELEVSTTSNNINIKNNNNQYQKYNNFNNFDQKSIMESSMMSQSTQKEDLRDLADVYFTCEYDYEKVLEYEINKHFGRIYPGMNDLEKRHVYLDGIDKAVNRIEKLQNYGEQIKDQIGENAMQNQHTLYMGTELIKVVATDTDDTLGKVQKSRVKLQNYKMLCTQKLKEINKLVKRKKRIEYVINFLEKFQLKYSSFIYSAKIVVSMNNLSQFEDLLVLIDSCNQQYLSGQQSSSLKVLKCLANVQIYTTDKLNLIYSTLQNFLTNELFTSFDSSPILKQQPQPFNLEKYKYVLRSYFSLEKQFQVAIPLSKTLIQYVKKALDISVLRSFQNAQSYIEKKTSLLASQRFQDNFQNSQNSVNLNQLQYMTGEQFAESMKRIFHHITLLLFNLEQCSRFHQQYQNYQHAYQTQKELDFFCYLAELDRIIINMKQEVSEAVLSKVKILIQGMNLDTYTSMVIDKIILMISQLLLIVKEYYNEASLEDTISVLKKVLMVKLKSHADVQINQLRQAILKDNWNRNKLPESYLNNLYFSLLRIQSKNERDGVIIHEQSKRIFNPNISVKAFTSQNRLLPNYSLNPVFAEVASNLKPFQQISMKDPDDPIDDLDQTSMHMLQSGQNTLFSMNAPQSSKSPQDFLQQNDYGNIGLRMYESVRPQEQEEAGQCCQSAILLIECVHSYLQLMKHLTPIGYEIFLEVQKIIEFYFYQTFTLFIDKKKIDDLININTDVHNLSSNIYNVEKQLNELAPFHENLLTYLPYKQLRTLIIKSIDYFESDIDPIQINHSLSQTQNNRNTFNISQQNNTYNCNKDINIFTLSCANNNYQINNVHNGKSMQSNVSNLDYNNRMMNASHMQSSVMTESSHVRRQKLMIQFDLHQRLSSVQSIYTLNKYLHLVQGQIVQHLSLIDTTSSVQNFVSRIIQEEIQNYLKQMKNYIIRDYCSQQLEKENIFQDFQQINWKPGDYSVDTQKPLYIENSIYFLKEFKEKIENDKYAQPDVKKQQLSPTLRLDLYRNMLEAWISIFLKNISSIKKYSEKGRSKLLNHYSLFIREVDSLLPIGHLKVQNDSVEKYIKIWNTLNPQELLQFFSQKKNEIPLSYLISIMSSNDKLTLFLSSQRQFDIINTMIYKEYLQFIIENN